MKVDINKNIKVSVIAPVYNVKDYLDRFIKSLINQTFKDIEIILVDDGSTDGCEKIIDDYKKIDDRIVAIHKKNSGVAKARNDGIKIAKGDYVCFFDSDDEVEKDAIEKLYENITKNKSKLVVSGFVIDTKINNKKIYSVNFIPKKQEVYHDKNLFRKDAYMYFDNNMFYPPWNKMYEKKYILDNNLLFPETYRDDFPFVVLVIKNIEDVCFIQDVTYRFKRERKDSETQKFIKNLYDKRIEEHNMLLDLYKSWNLEEDYNSQEMLSRRFLDRILECIVNDQNKLSNLNFNKKIVNIKKYISSDYALTSLNFAYPRSIYLKIIYFLIKNKKYLSLYLLSKLIFFVNKNFLHLFVVLKNNR